MKVTNAEVSCIVGIEGIVSTVRQLIINKIIMRERLLLIINKELLRRTTSQCLSNSLKLIKHKDLQRVYLLKELAALTISKADYRTVITTSRMKFQTGLR